MRNGRCCDAAARSCIERAGACRTMVHHRVRCHNFTSMKLRRTRATRYSYSRLFVLGDVASAGEPLPVERLVSAGLRLEVR